MRTYVFVYVHVCKPTSTTENHLFKHGIKYVGIIIHSIKTSLLVEYGLGLDEHV